MNERQWEQVKSIFASALEVSPPDRSRWLELAQDKEVQAEVRRLLDSNSSSLALLSAPFGEGAPRGPHQPLLQSGEILNGRFEIRALLGYGGMGEVYLASDMEIREDVALKTLRLEYAELPALVARLKKEVQIARRIQHPNICRVHDLHRATNDRSEIFFLVMEFLRGETLRAFLARGPCPLSRSMVLIDQLSLALQAAHDAGILHRDLKSENVILTDTPEGGPRAVITDFGLSREIRPAAETQSLFGPNAIVGTPAYMAPEQLRGETVSPACDIYSLGVVAFEIIAGRLPFEGETALAIALKRLREPPPPLRKFRPDVPAHWDWVIQSCLSVHPSDRPASPRAFFAMLQGGAHPRFWVDRYGRRAAIGLIAVSACAGAVRWMIPAPARKPEAVASFKRGEEFVRRRNRESIANAIQEFRSAVDLEPQYAKAWAGLAEAYAAAAHYGFLEAKETRLNAQQAAQTALGLDKHLAKARAVMAYLASIDLERWRLAEPDFKRALILDANEPLTHAWYAAFLGRMGRFDEAIREAQRAVELDPASFYFNHQLAAEYFRAERFPEYNRQALTLIRLQPFEPSGYLTLARSAEWLGRFDEALRYCDEAEKYGNSPTALAYRGTIEAARGNLARARDIARQVTDYWQKNPFESSVLINLFARLGEYDRVMDILEEGYEKGDSNVLAAPTTVYLKPMRDLPRYKAFLKKLGIDPAGGS